MLQQLQLQQQQQQQQQPTTTVPGWLRHCPGRRRVAAALLLAAAAMSAGRTPCIPSSNRKQQHNSNSGPTVFPSSLPSIALPPSKLVNPNTNHPFSNSKFKPQPQEIVRPDIFWYDAPTKIDLPFNIVGLLAFEFWAMQFVELKRWQDFKNPGSVDQDPLFPNNKLAPHEVRFLVYFLV
jgi:hypothetical protein